VLYFSCLLYLFCTAQPKAVLQAQQSCRSFSLIQLKLAQYKYASSLNSHAISTYLAFIHKINFSALISLLHTLKINPHIFFELGGSFFRAIFFTFQHLITIAEKMQCIPFGCVIFGQSAQNKRLPVHIVWRGAPCSLALISGADQTTGSCPGARTGPPIHQHRNLVGLAWGVLAHTFTF
jgi:hypothetical protein